MSILIKGISSLKDGLCQIQDGKIHAYKGNGGKTEGYYLIEVPPHGRLIDADETKEALRRAEALTRAFGYHNVIQTVSEVPTIIEAEEGEE